METSAYTLVIGNKNYSSWSLRPWLAMRKAGIAFDEERVELREPGAHARIVAHSPSGLVPALKTGGATLWDSLAILEFLAETHADTALWPAESEPRAMARTVSAEMHSGFYHLRDQVPMDFVRTRPASRVSDHVAANIARIVEIWRHCRSGYGRGGEFLFGDFSIADAMYAPVASRFRTFTVDLAAHGDDGTAQAYCAHILAMPELETWAQEARQELEDHGEEI